MQEQQRQEILPRLVRGDAVVALGISEPDTGSDAAGARTRAQRDGAVSIGFGECRAVLLSAGPDTRSGEASS